MSLGFALQSYVKSLEERLIANSVHINESSCVVVYLCGSKFNVHMVCVLGICKNSSNMLGREIGSCA